METKLQELKYRYQFFYGKTPLPLERWTVYTMPNGNCLSAHPELSVTQIEQNGFQVTLLGFMLDPDRPDDKDVQILTRLSESAGSIDQWIESTEPIGGRWLIFLHQGDSGVVFNDPGGLRTTFWHVDAEGNPWLGTQPGLFQLMFGFKVSKEAASYMASPRYQEKVETWWAGDSAPFAEIKHLLPNHYFDLKARKVVRFWPIKPLKQMSLDEGVKIAAQTLKGMIEAAHKRFPLAVALSSGLDSRMMLAATKDFAEDVFVFSMMYRHLTTESDDVKVPREITRAVNLTHHIVDARVPMSEEFGEVYNQTLVGTKDDWGNLVEARFKHIPQGRLILKGTISEIVRVRFWSVGVYPYRVTLRDLVRILNLGKDPLVVKSLKDWMIDVLPAEKLGYKLLDLLSWENEIGNWLALGHVVNDLSHQDFAPISNRRFINTMLGVDPKYRSYPDHIMERRITAALWPELAKFPYSPSRKVPHKRFIDGPILNGLRWVRYFLFEEKHGRLEE
ncbi:MAG TPA: hypothetical protein VN364_04735 [Bellilinea sp.]|nr:hypothetical protein [Bellilinea sp.]